MDNAKQQLIDEATLLFGEISPCYKDLWDGFTVFNGELLFWFNTNDRSTHMVSTKIL